MAFSRTASQTVSWRAAALGTVSALALAGLASPLAAQTATGTPPDTAPAEPDATNRTTDESEAEDSAIIVTGFRQSLATAQVVKQNADTVVDVITAEDIGALADRSVAEALQRVPGVNISRFVGRDDPDRFSVEGSNVIIRGLPFVLSQLNGRDIFSADGGRVLSFNDVSPELLGRVEIYKNVSADMIEGNISGLVNLVTRKPLDRSGFKAAGTVEVNYGDMAKEWSPGFSGLVSNTWDTNIGRFGVQLGYAQQELITKTDASQITDPCYRAPTLDEPCLRIVNVGSGGYGGNPNFNADNFPPPGALLVPKGGGVRTTELSRDRQAYSGVLQWESNDERAKVTLEYLRAETQNTVDEYSMLALVNDDALFPIPANTWTFDENGLFQTGILTQAQPFTGGRGIPTELLRLQSRGEAKTEDFSLDIDLAPTDRLRFNFEVQHIKSDRIDNGFIAAMSTYTDLAIDNSGKTPQIQFLQPSTTSNDAGYFNDPALTLYSFVLDNQLRNDGDLTSMRFDAEYDVSDEGFLRTAKFGARWADRSRVTRNANFSNWGHLGAPWTGRNGNWNCDDFQAFGCGGAYVRDFPDSAQIRNPFADNFQRGKAPIPTSNGSAFFFGADDVLSDYLNGTLDGVRQEIVDFTLTPEGRPFIGGRTGLVPGTVWRPGEITDVEESTDAYYARLDFGTVFGNGWELSGNIGVRYANTTIRTRGNISFPTGEGFDNEVIIDGVNVGGNQNGVVELFELQNACSRVGDGQVAPGYCNLSLARQLEFISVFTGEVVPNNASFSFSNWIPAFNAKLDFGGGLLLRAAVSKGISRPDLGVFSGAASIFDNTTDLRQGGGLADGPLFQVFTGNIGIRPVEAWNYDLSLEYYFDAVGSVTAALFKKDFKNLTATGQTVRSFTSPSGVTTDVEVNGPVNLNDASIHGIELAYQDTFEFLPGFLDGLGTQLTYTYIKSGDFSSAGDILGPLPQPGLSKHTVNATVFYEKGPIALRAAYNWRSEFLQTPRDVIFPFSPIYGEATGQLDGSIFFAVTDRIKLGVQGVNLLDEVTRTSQVVDFDGRRVTRSAFRNDRRYTFLLRFDF